MPERPLTIATYAAGASLAAITLVYVFGPTFFIDNESNSASSRKRGVVGLVNPANDCFINSVLQALAGLGDLRVYLIRETHRRSLDGPTAYAQLIKDPARPDMPAWKVEGLQAGLVTQGLKEILDALNERPIYKKTISASNFVQVLEHAFKQTISRQQQDAQEFLQVVAERLCDEYHAGSRVRKHMRQIKGADLARQSVDDGSVRLESQDLSIKETKPANCTPTISEPAGKQQLYSRSRESGVDGDSSEKRPPDHEEKYQPEEEGFPLEGVSESHIECTTCRFKPKPTKSTFCTLTLSVPQVSSTSLSSCFDQLFKREEIEDFKCDKCRLQHAVERFQKEMAKSNSEPFTAKTQQAIERIQLAIETDPEAELKDVELPDRKFAPKRKIEKYLRITKFPKVLAIHLSRSIFDVGRSTLKNSAKVSFPEQIPLGGLLNQRMYRLLSVVCHKGSHHSGHYESFRRQNFYPPFATSNTFQISGVYSKPTTPAPSAMSTPQISPSKRAEDSSPETVTLSSTPDLLSPSTASSPSTSCLPYLNSRHSTDSRKSINGHMHSSPESTTASTETAVKSTRPTSAARQTDTSSIKSIARTVRSTISKVSSKDPVSPVTLTSPTEANNLRPDSDAKDTIRSPINIVNGIGRKKKSHGNRWWRISDEKIKECKTSEVLAMQKEVYLLFYELVEDEEV